MVILYSVTRKRTGRVERFNKMEDLLIAVNKMLQKSSSVPYLILENDRVIATWESYFSEVHKKKADYIKSVIQDYLSGKQMEREKNFNDNTRVWKGRRDE